jgi:MFS family permease
MALCVGLGGLIGSLGIGAIATRLRRRFARAEIWVLSVALFLTGPALLATLYANSTPGALAAMFALYVLSYSWGGPTSAMIQRVSPVRSRSLAAGLQLSIATVIALLFGPPVVGHLSDLLRPEFGEQSIRHALAYAAVVSVIGAAIYLLAARHVLRDADAG